jgi:hypothetical protein
VGRFRSCSFHHDDRLIILRRFAGAKRRELGDEPGPERFRRADIDGPHEYEESRPIQFRTGRVRRFRNAVAVEHDDVVRLRLDDHPVVGHVRQQTQRRAGHAPRDVGPVRLQPCPFSDRGTIPERWRMSGVRHDHQPSTPVPANRDHRGVVAAKVFPQGAIQIAHQRNLLEIDQVHLHEVAELFAERGNRLAVAAHVRKRDPRHDAARADGCIVNIAAKVIGRDRHGVHPGRQAWKFDRTGGLRISGPRFRAREASGRRLHRTLHADRSRRTYRSFSMASRLRLSFVKA